MSLHYPAASADDARQLISDGSMLLTETDGQIIGTHHVGIRFTNVTWAQGSVVTSAILKLKLNNYTGFGNITNVVVYGEKITNSTQFNASANNISTRLRTTANIAANTIPATDAVETVGIDVTAIVNEILGQVGWSSGNALTILFIGSGSAGSMVQPYFYDYFSGNQKASLEITNIITQNRTQTGKGAILKTTTRTQNGLSKIVFTPQRTQTGKARIQNDVQQNQTGKGNINNDTLRHQLGTSNIRYTTIGDQNGLSRIERIVSQTQTGKGAILVPTTRNQTGQTRVVNTYNRHQFGTARIAEKPLFPGKRYEYKVYTPSGDYVATLKNVISDFTYSQEINSAGSQFSLILGENADNYGEGETIAFGNNIKVYVFDQDTPTGTKLFDGYISNYTPMFSAGGEQVSVTVLGYGATLGDYLIEAGESLAFEQTTESGGWVFGNPASMSNHNRVAQVVQATATEKWGRFEFKLNGIHVSNANVNTRLNIYAGSNPASPGSVIASTTQLVLDADNPAVYSFTLGTPLSVTSGSSYILELEPVSVFGGGSDQYSLHIATADSNAYANGAFWVYGNGSGYSSQTDDMWFKIYKTTGSTKAPFLSEDPSDILRAIIDDYNNKGGKITYDNDSIDDTGTTVSYTFNTNSTLEGVTKCLELAPQGWYFYVDQATNLLHFHQKVESPDYLFLLDKHIEKLDIQKSIENVVNAVYFTGGELTPGDPDTRLFKKYTRQSSIDAYGLKVQRLQDQRVTVEATALIMANSILDTKSAPALSTHIEIIDNAIDPTIGYDLETIILGKMIALGGPGLAGEGNSFWDKMVWDVDYWDYNLEVIGTLVLQITRLTYNGDKVSLDLSTVPPDVNKRIEDINRNLEAAQTFDNPEAPED